MSGRDPDSPPAVPGGADAAPAPRRDAPPPLLGTWPRVYALILGWLGLLVLLMHLFTQRYR